MDVEMPEMNGIEAVERIMADYPTPVVMLSAHTDENADVTFEALDKGAVDFFTKPGGEVSMEMSRLKDQTVEIVTTVAQVDVARSNGGRIQVAYRDRPRRVVRGRPDGHHRFVDGRPEDGRARALGTTPWTRTFGFSSSSTCPRVHWPIRRAHRRPERVRRPGGDRRRAYRRRRGASSRPVTATCA